MHIENTKPLKKYIFRIEFFSLPIFGILLWIYYADKDIFLWHNKFPILFIKNHYKKEKNLFLPDFSAVVIHLKSFTFEEKYSESFRV